MGGYSDYSVSDLQWQSIHMSVAASCRAITATGGSGDQPNRVYARSKGTSCNEVCKGTPYKECDAELTIMGNMVVAKSSILVDAAGLHAQEAWLEEGLGAPEPLVADGDDRAVGQLVGLLQGGGGGSGRHLLLEVQGDVAQLL